MYLCTFWAAMFNLVTLIQLPAGSDILTFGLLALLTIILGLVLTERVPIVQNVLTGLARRLTIFLYLWIPVSVMALAVVLFRIFSS
jgi:hypothetical protein